MKKLGIIAVSALLLAGCAAAPMPDNPTPDVTDTSEIATQEQVASVISRDQGLWREVGDSTLECRGVYVDSRTGDPIAELEALSCFTRQRTALVTAGAASKGLRALTPPESMVRLVDETVLRLDNVKKIDLGVCGDAPDPTEESCDGALTELDFAMRSLVSTLNAWAPYV